MTDILDLSSLSAVLLRRRSQFMLPMTAVAAVAGTADHLSHAVSLQCNLESLGYAFTGRALALLSTATLSLEELALLEKLLDTTLREQLGAHRLFDPMYPNFPKQVIKASDLELLLNALLHYTGDWLGVRILPDYVKKPRKALKLSSPPKLLDIATIGDVRALFAQMAASNVALSADDLADMAVLLDFFNSTGIADKLIRAAAPTIVQKENLAAFTAVAVNRGHDAVPLLAAFASATDVLRLGMALSGGDVSLSALSKLKSFTRKERKLLLGLLDRIGETDPNRALADLFLRREVFLRLGERLHPGEYSAQFPTAHKLFEDLRATRKPENENHVIQTLIEAGETAEAVALLARRPGVLARSLANVLRKSDAESRAGIIEVFAQVAAQVSTPVLLQVMNYFRYPGPAGLRVFMPKALTGKLFTLADADLDNSGLAQCRDRVAEICEAALVSRFGELESLGNVYVDPLLRSQFVPFAQRSASKALRTIARGSRIDLPAEDKITRFFLWWSETGQDKNGQALASSSRIDVDLSVVALDADFGYVSHCSWTELRNAGMTHSGDITSAPKGACEFIDVCYEKLPADWAYIVLVVNSFTGQTFAEMPECFVGWMGRQHGNRGEVFEPRTVQNKIDLTVASQMAMPAVIDVKHGQVIWADLAVKAASGYYYVEKQTDRIALATKGLANLNKPRLYDLFELHARARGLQVPDPKLADTVFSMTEGVTPFAYEKIASEFLI